MKASRVIKGLQSLIDEFGDREVEVNGEYNDEIPINTHSFFEVIRIDLFPDSDNYQILVRNE